MHSSTATDLCDFNVKVRIRFGTAPTSQLSAIKKRFEFRTVLMLAAMSVLDITSQLLCPLSSSQNDDLWCCMIA